MALAMEPESGPESPAPLDPESAPESSFEPALEPEPGAPPEEDPLAAPLEPESSGAMKLLSGVEPPASPPPVDVPGELLELQADTVAAVVAITKKVPARM